MAEMMEMSGGSPDRPRRAWLWPAIVIGLLGGHMLILGAMIAVATTDPSVAIEPDYYQKALDWDQQAAQREANRRLGWTLTPAIAGAANLAGQRELTVDLKDADGKPIEGASVQVLAFHNARAAERVEATLAQTRPGRYAARLAMRRTGLWEVRFVARHGADCFTLVDTLEAAGGSGR